MSDLGSDSEEVVVSLNEDDAPIEPTVKLPPGLAATTLKFADVCNLFEKIATAPKGRKQHLYKDFMAKWRAMGDDNLFPFLRLAMPKMDRERGAYGVKEAKLARIYKSALQLPDADADRLINWKAPTSGNAGDFATTAFCSEKASSTEPHLSVANVDMMLDQLAAADVAKNDEEKTKTLRNLLRTTTATEQKWLIRIILKDLKTGLGSTGMLKGFHPDAVDLYNICNDLRKISYDLRDPATRVSAKDIVLGNPFSPMLADKCHLAKINQLLDGKEWVVETKFDGDRVMLHYDRRANMFKFFSRNAKDFSDGQYAYTSIRDMLETCFSDQIESFILDGEMICYDPAIKQLVPKGMTKVDVKHVHKTGQSSNGDGNDLRPCFVVFDMVLVNGKSIAGLPLLLGLTSKRQELLRQHIGEKEGYLHLVTTKEVKSAEDVYAAVNAAIDDREEGVILKLKNSIYEPDERKGGWYKLKPEYVSELSDHLDLIIVGGYFAKGIRRGGQLSHFLLGVRTNDTTPQGYPVFHSFCRVGSGYTDAELRDLASKIKFHKFNPSDPPPFLLLPPGQKERPDMFADPSTLMVISVKAAEVNVSDKFKTGYTLRFPRVDRFRWDKKWEDAMHADEVPVLFAKARGKLASKHVSADGVADRPAKRRKAEHRSVPEHFRATDVSHVVKESELFDGMQFYIVNGTETHSKSELERLVKAHGGSFVQNYMEGTDVVVACKKNVRVGGIINKYEVDIIKPQWLLDCISTKTVVPKAPHHMLHSTEETQKAILLDFDEYTDSYTQNIDSLDDMTQLLQAVRNAKGACDTPGVLSEMAEVCRDYMPPRLQQSFLFLGLCFYVDMYLLPGDPSTLLHASPLRITQHLIECCLGKLSTNPEHPSVSHVIVDESDRSRVAALDIINRGREKKFHVVSSVWVEACIKHGRLLPELHYGVRAPR